MIPSLSSHSPPQSCSGHVRVFVAFLLVIMLPPLPDFTFPINSLHHLYIFPLFSLYIPVQGIIWSLHWIVSVFCVTCSILSRTRVSILVVYFPFKDIIIILLLLLSLLLSLLLFLRATGALAPVASLRQVD